jgi:hypothetical protein
VSRDHRVYKDLWDFKDAKAFKVSQEHKDLKAQQFLVYKVHRAFKVQLDFKDDKVYRD